MFLEGRKKGGGDSAISPRRARVGSLRQEMDATLLIDAIVRQTVVLVAELATSGGLRAPLAHVADQVFLELSRELEAQGVSRKVSADMFGMALRTYQRKVQRIQESVSARGQTLWQAVHDYIRSRDVVARREVLEKFRLDDETLVRGVLSDLVDSGFVFATGPSSDTTFRAATDAEFGAVARARTLSNELVAALLFRNGPCSAAALSALVDWDRSRLEEVLARLVAEGLAQRDDSGAEPVFSVERLIVPLEAPSGWEAAVYDHYHSVVRTICARLRQSRLVTAPNDTTGGSTFTLEVWESHPLLDEVLGTLARLRADLSALRERVLAHNRQSARPPSRLGTTVYCGQFTWEIEDNDEKVP
jgi:hypothetical protein